MGKEMKVLVVDDEADFRQLMTVWLESKGYSVATAPDGKAALEIVKSQPPAIIFMDLNMPVMDGVTALKEIRKFNKDIPVIVISAYADRMMIKEAKPFGISGLFYKDEEFEKCLSLLESTLRTHKKLK